MELSKRMKNIAGQTFGSLTAIRPITKEGRNVVWCFKCSCGKHVVVAAHRILIQEKKSENPLVPSCGCIGKQVNQQPKTHGMTGHALFKLYHRMLDRCYNVNTQNYSTYGAKGVHVCAEWKDNPERFFQWALINGWKEGLVLDKDILCDKLGIHPKVYSPNTCQFITQSLNSHIGARRENFKNHPNMKVSCDQAEELYQLYINNTCTKAELAIQFGIVKATVNRIIKQKELTK